MPRAELSSQRWPEEHYAAVANAKLDAVGSLDIWITKDGVVAERIQELTAERCINLTGKQAEEALISSHLQVCRE